MRRGMQAFCREQVAPAGQAPLAEQLPTTDSRSTFLSRAKRPAFTMSFRMHSGCAAQAMGSLASLAAASTLSSSKKRSHSLSSAHDAGVQ